MLRPGHFLTQRWQILAHIQKRILEVEESIAVVLKQQRVTKKPAALSLSEIKCSQVILAYTKKHIHAYC